MTTEDEHDNKHPDRARVLWAASRAAEAAAEAHQAAERVSIGAGSTAEPDALDELDEYDRTVLYPPGTPKRTVYSATRPNFTLGALQEKINELTQIMTDLATDLEQSQELWNEYDDHCQNWRFSPEELTAELVCAALTDEIDTYCNEHPPESSGTLNRWNYDAPTDEWADAFWQWLIAQPLADRLIRRSEANAMCFLTSSARHTTRGKRHSLMFLRYVHARVIEWICEHIDRRATWARHKLTREQQPEDE